MGRSLLLACATAFFMSTLAMGSLRRNILEQDARVTTFESDVIARENAMSALNQAVPFLVSRFDSLVAGQTVDTRSLIGNANTPQGNAYGLLRALTASSNRLRLRANGAAETLLPTREISGGSTQQASIRLLGNGTLELTAEGTQMLSQAGGSATPVSFKIRRVYAKASPLDAAVIALAPAIAPTFSGNYRIDGRDTDPSTMRLTGQTTRDRNGIKTNTATVAQRIGGVVGASNRDRVMGVAGAGDIVTGATQADLSGIFDEAFTHPNRTVLTTATVGSASYGSASAPAIVVRNGDLTLTGNLRGTGALIINGDLTTTSSGKLVWDGLVMVRKDASSTSTSPNLTATLGNGSQITGSYVLMQGASAFVMPFQGRVQVNYLGSWDAGLFSSVGIEHARNGQLVQNQLVAPGANRLGTVSQTYSADLQAGDLVNFFIGVHYPTWFGTPALAGTEAYKNYARGHFDAATGKPYGVTDQTGDYTWRMAFEDLRNGLDIGFGSTPDWDYNVAGREDQVIEVKLQCRSYRNGALYTVSGVQQYEDCTPNNPDTHQQDVALNWTGLTAGSGVVANPMGGTLLTMGLHGATVAYSTASIGRLTPLLHVLRERSEVVMVDSWTSR